MQVEETPQVDEQAIAMNQQLQLSGVFLLASLQTSPEAQAYIAVMQDQLQGLSRIDTHMLSFTGTATRGSAVLREVSDFIAPRLRGKEKLFISALRRRGSFWT